jgi:hypothetical protein
MIQGEQVPLIMKMREYVASIKPLDLKVIIIDILKQLAPKVEQLQREQWKNNTLQSGSKMGNYEPSTIKRYNKTSPVINLFEKGEMYRDLKAKVDETLKNMFVIEVESSRWANNYIYLGKNVKIGLNEAGEPGFMGLTEENANIIRVEFIKMLNQRLAR